MNYFLGLIGHPTAHSLSPYMHKAALKHFGLEGDYQLFDIPQENNQSNVQEAIKKIIASAKTNTQTTIGLNVTVPHKDVALQFADKLTEAARHVNAVNCLKESNDGQVIGHNTDLEGFIQSVKETAVLGEPACVLGTGGAAKAAVLGLSRLGYKEIAIVFRNRHRATALLSYFTKLCPKVKFKMIDCQDLVPLSQCDLLVNSTSIGLDNDPPPEWVEKFFDRLPSNCFFYDMVYRKDGGPTTLINLAQARNVKAIDGIDMLINQAIASFNFWTNLNCPKAVMQNALSQARTI